MARRMAAGVNVRSLRTIRDGGVCTLLAHRWTVVATTSSHRRYCHLKSLSSSHCARSAFLSSSS